MSVEFEFGWFTFTQCSTKVCEEAQTSFTMLHFTKVNVPVDGQALVSGHFGSLPLTFKTKKVYF